MKRAVVNPAAKQRLSARRLARPTTAQPRRKTERTPASTRNNSDKTAVKRRSTDGQMAKMRHELQAVHDQLNTEKSSNDNLNYQLNVQREMIRKLENEKSTPFGAIESQLRAEQLERQNCETEIVELRQKVQEYSELLQYHQQRHESDLKMINELRNQVLSIEQKCDSMETPKVEYGQIDYQKVNMSAELAQVRQENERLTDQLNRQREGSNLPSSALYSENLVLRQDIENLLKQKSDSDARAASLQEHVERLNDVVTQQEMKFTGVFDDNRTLKQNIEGLEVKNKQLLASLERNVADRAREYKEKTVDTLTFSPQALRQAIPKSTEYQAEKEEIQSRSYDIAPQRPSTHRASAGLGEAVYQDNYRNWLDQRPSSYRGPVTHSNMSKYLDKRYVSPEKKPVINLIAPKDSPGKPYYGRTTPQLDVSRSAERLVEVLTTPPLSPPQTQTIVNNPEKATPNMRGVNTPSSILKSSLSEIKAKLTSLQYNKAILEDKMGEFERRIGQPK